MKKRTGFTLIEVIIDAFIITAIFAALAAAFILTLQTVNSGNARLAASNLVNEQMERLRNLSYDDLATENGTILPQGTIPDTQTVTRGNVRLILETTIITIDDPVDGCAIPQGTIFLCTDQGTSAIRDMVPVDYKRITLRVRSETNERILAELSSNVAARAAETPSNTGILLIIIQDAQGLPVSGATVRITNPDTNVDVTAVTNLLGHVFIANVPPDRQNGYHLLVTKAGFSTSSTTHRTPQNPNQINPNVDVFAQQITTQTLAIDRLSNLTLTVKDPAGNAVANREFTIVGEKLIFFNPNTPKNTFTARTDASGIIALNSIEWDSYVITIENGHTIVSTSPYQPIALNPNSNLNVNLTVVVGSNWPRIETVSPSAGVSGQSVIVVIEGSNLSGISSVELRLAGQASIQATEVDPHSNGGSVTMRFNLVGAAAGSWDLIISDGTRTTTQLEGFVIT